MKINLVGGSEIEHDGGRSAGLFNVQVKMNECMVALTVSNSGEYYLSVGGVDVPEGREVARGNAREEAA